jgi:hypothetical protein
VCGRGGCGAKEIPHDPGNREVGVGATVAPMPFAEFAYVCYT